MAPEELHNRGARWNFQPEWQIMAIQVNHQYPVNVAEKHPSGKRNIKVGRVLKNTGIIEWGEGNSGATLLLPPEIFATSQHKNLLSSLRLSSAACIKMFNYHAAFPVSCSRINTCF